MVIKVLGCAPCWMRDNFRVRRLLISMFSATKKKNLNVLQQLVHGPLVVT